MVRCASSWSRTTVIGFCETLNGRMESLGRASELHIHSAACPEVPSSSTSMLKLRSDAASLKKPILTTIFDDCVSRTDASNSRFGKVWGMKFLVRCMQGDSGQPKPNQKRLSLRRKGSRMSAHPRRDGPDGRFAPAHAPITEAGLLRDGRHQHILHRAVSKVQSLQHLFASHRQDQISMQVLSKVVWGPFPQ